MRKLTLLVGALLLAAAPAFAADMAAPAGSDSAPAVTSATPESPAPSEGAATGKPDAAAKAMPVKGKKHTAHKHSKKKVTAPAQ